jgi:HK97 family phage major capsid protein
MTIEIQDLKERRNSLLTQMQTVAMNKGGFNAERRTQFDKMQKDVEALDADIQRSETMAEYDREARQFTRSPRPGIGNGQGISGSGEEKRDKINADFRSYARTGRIEERSLLTTADATGGALIPVDFYPELTNALKFFGPIATKVKQRVTDSNGSPLKISLGTDTTNGLTLLATEGSSVPVETDPVFQSKLLGVDTVTGGLVKISFEEMADSSFNLDTAIRDYFGMRYGRGLEVAITTGKDSAGTTLPNQSSGGLLGAATVGTTTATLAGGIGWTDLANVFASLDPAYSITPSWVMNSATRSYLIGLKDGFGKPYFLNSPGNSAPFDSIMGFPIVLNQAMPNMGASATPILFGDLEKSYLLRTDGAPSILRLNERFADQLMVGFYLWTRVGGLSLAAGIQPLVSIKQAASYWRDV